MTSDKHSYLRRPAPEFYRGYAYVHWSMTMHDRRTGWLDGTFHAAFREYLLHTLSRYMLVCPVYCLMPDHFHLLFIGLRESTDQRKAVRFFRKHLNLHLKSTGFHLQTQAYDNVLREKDRERGAFLRTIYYVTENPVRANLCEVASDWLYSGSLAPGYPIFDWRDEKFEHVLWKVVETEQRKDVPG